MHRLPTTKQLISSIFALTLLIFSAHTLAKYEGSPLEPIQKMVNAGKYDQAIAKLKKLLAKDRNDADILSLMGYSYRKQKEYGLAVQYYNRALTVDPEHKAANEYLGQLFLETGQLEKAKERLAILDEACFFACDEYETLEKAINEYQQ